MINYSFEVVKDSEMFIQDGTKNCGIRGIKLFSVWADGRVITIVATVTGEIYVHIC